MNDCYLNFLVSFRALFSLDVGANLVNSKQTIGIILPDLSLLGYAVPVESFGIGLFVILFAYLIIEYNVQLDIPSYGWGARCRRICTWGYFKDLRSGKKFYVFNSHTDHEATEARRQSSFMLLEQVRKIAKGRPTFCTGDFNATPDEEPVQLLLKDSLLLDSYKCTLTPPKGPSGSFYAYDKTGKTAKRIDFIFVTPKIKILSYHTIDDDIKYNKYSSDHFPVMVEALLK